MRKLALFITLLLIIVAAAPGPAHASFISIEVESGVELLQNKLKVSVKVTNKGDESASNLKTSIESGGRWIYGKPRKDLAPNEHFTEEFTEEVSFEKPGRYPVLISVDYTDANQYPFNAMTVSYADYGDAPNARVTGSIGVLRLSDSDSLKVSVKNVDEVGRKVSVRLVTSKEFAVSNKVQEIALVPGDEKKVIFEIRNSGGLSGSTYPVFALITCEDTAYRYLNVASGNIIVVKRGVWHKLKAPLAILLGILLTVILLFYLFRLKGIFAQSRQARKESHGQE
jgi:hypothetical protein